LSRDYLSNLYSLFVLSIMMFDDRSEEEILSLAMTSVPALGPCWVEAAYVVRDRRLTPLPGGTGEQLDSQVLALRGAEGSVSLPSRAWGRALALRSFGGHTGYVVVAAKTEPSRDELFLVKVLVQQTAAALANASLHRAEREHARELKTLNDERAAVNERLTTTVSDLERQTTIHEELTKVSASGAGEDGIAEALHKLTGLPVAVEDCFGNLRTWSGPDRPTPYPSSSTEAHEDVLRRAACNGRPLRHKDRLIALAQPRSEILGVLALIDPGRTAGHHEEFALEQAATVLALELAHARNLAEVELRLRRELVEDLLTGTDEESAFARSEALGHDLHGAHHVAVVQWHGRANDDAVATAVARATAGAGLKALLARCTGEVVALIKGRPDENNLYDAVARELGSTTGSIGIGGRCDCPVDLPRSYHEARRALDIRQKSRCPDGATAFDELGVYRILVGGEDDEVQQFVRDWLGSLIDYDQCRRSDLVRTLSQYLECGGNYDDTAEALVIHRSTLRYRLQRIREITGLDLGDVDSRLNLHLATRAWKIASGSS
jgi:sugar diacid utilization regulator